MATVTVTDLMLNFANACRSLVPMLDRAVVPWGDEEQYDNWDRVAEALFESLVAEPCAFQAVGEARLAQLRIVPYGYAPAANYNAWFVVVGEQESPFLKLSSFNAPFADAQCAEPAGMVPLEASSFVFVYNDGHGEQRLERVDLAAE